MLRFTLPLVVVVLALAPFAYAGEQFALYGLQSLTNHEDLPHPAGVGAFLQKDLSRELRLRFSASFGYDHENYKATINKGWGMVAPGDTVRDFWYESSRMRVFELSLLGRPFESRIINVFVGGGVGLTSFDWKVRGDRTGFEKSASGGPRLAFSLLGDFEIAHSSIDPLIFHFWIRERVTMGTLFQCDDCGTKFDNAITSAEMALALALRM